MPFILLDRDGVINHDSVEYIKSPAEWVPIPGSLEAIARLNKAGYRVIIVTNQSGLARGYYDLATLTKIHEKFINALSAVGGKVEEIFFCPHLPAEQCACRKPEPGMFHDIAKKYAIDLAQTIFIGDSMSDVQAALNAGCQPALVLTGNGVATLAKLPADTTVKQFNDLAHAAAIICEGE
jgi:D-glycero-D-manno-heptose 1,7-bisphosphate phosphatase